MCLNVSPEHSVAVSTLLRVCTIRNSTPVAGPLIRITPRLGLANLILHSAVHALSVSHVRSFLLVIHILYVSVLVSRRFRLQVAVLALGIVQLYIESTEFFQTVATRLVAVLHLMGLVLFLVAWTESIPALVVIGFVDCKLIAHSALEILSFFVVLRIVILVRSTFVLMLLRSSDSRVLYWLLPPWGPHVLMLSNLVSRCLMPSSVVLTVLLFLVPVHVSLLVVLVANIVSVIWICSRSGPVLLLVVNSVIHLVLGILLLMDLSLLLHLSLVLLIKLAVHISFVVIHFKLSLFRCLIIIRQLYHVFNPFILYFALGTIGWVNVILNHLVNCFARLALPIIFFESIVLVLVLLIDFLVPILKCQDILWLLKFVGLEILHELKVSLTLLVIPDKFTVGSFRKVIRSFADIAYPDHDTRNRWRLLFDLLVWLSIWLLVSWFASWFQRLPIVCLLAARLFFRLVHCYLAWNFHFEFLEILECSFSLGLGDLKTFIVVVICRVATRTLLVMEHKWILAIPTVQYVYLIFNVLLLQDM